MTGCPVCGRNQHRTRYEVIVHHGQPVTLWGWNTLVVTDRCCSCSQRIWPWQRVIFDPHPWGGYDDPKAHQFYHAKCRGTVELREAVLGIHMVVSRMLANRDTWNSHWDGELGRALRAAGEVVSRPGAIGGIPLAVMDYWHEQEARTQRIWKLGGELRSLAREDPERVKAEAQETLEKLS